MWLLDFLLTVSDRVLWLFSAEGWARIRTVVSDTWSGVIDFIRIFMDRIRYVIQYYWTRTWDYLFTRWSEWIRFFEDAYARVMNICVHLYTRIFEIFYYWYERLRSIIVDWFLILRYFVEQFYGMTLFYLIGIADFFAEVVWNVYDWLYLLLTDYWNRILYIVVVLGGAFSEWLVTDVRRIYDIITNFGEQLMFLVLDGFEVLVAIVNDPVSYLWSLFNDVYETFVEKHKLSFYRLVESIFRFFWENEF